MAEAFAYEVSGENLTDHWLTPPELIQAAGPFDLDPCAYEKQPWSTAFTMYKLPEQNGLLLPWEGCVFCNPPYGPEVEKWARRLALHDNGLLLVFARTETLSFRPVWHFATFPGELIKTCILAGCPAGGTVLDPFLGSGTTAMVAEANACKAIGIELNEEYIKMALRRLKQKGLEFA